MSVLAIDVLLKTMCEAAFADLRKNTWILDDVFSGLAIDPLAKAEYGYKEVERAKEWFLNNQIDVYLLQRIDNPKFPCVTIVQTGDREMIDRASLADDGMIIETDPEDITRQVQKIVTNFTPAAYDPSTGTVTLPANLATNQIVAGQYLVSSRSSHAYIITQVVDDQNFKIAAKTTDDFTDAYIAPGTSLWNLHTEQSFFEEAFAIGIHAQSDVNQILWFRQLMKYVFLRYKEAYLERRGFEISTFSVGSIDENPNFQGAEKVFSCPLTLSGVTETRWVKFAAPKLQGVSGGILIIDGPQTPEEYLKWAKRQGWKMDSDRNR